MLPLPHYSVFDKRCIGIFIYKKNKLMNSKIENKLSFCYCGIYNPHEHSSRVWLFHPFSKSWVNKSQMTLAKANFPSQPINVLCFVRFTFVTIILIDTMKRYVIHHKLKNRQMITCTAFINFYSYDKLCCITCLQIMCYIILCGWCS